MKTGAAGINAHILLDSTTLSLCCKIERADGTILGFTDHDVDISYGGITFKAANAISPFSIDSSSDLKIDNLEIEGIINSAEITDEDILAGRYDSAEVWLFLINWVTPADGIIKMRYGTIGEISFRDSFYVAELRGLIQRLQTNLLKNYTPECSAEFGDSITGCYFDLTTVRQTGAIDTVIDRKNFTIAGITVSAEDEFNQGRIVMTGGANRGLTFEIRNSTLAGAIQIFLKAPFDFASTDGFTIISGCDKQFVTCQAKGQYKNFRGFNLLPGKDALYSYPDG